MKCVILTKCTVAHGLGGVEVYVHTIARTAAALGHDVLVVTTAHPRSTATEVRDGYRVEYLAGTPPAVYSRAFFRASAQAVRGHVGYDLLCSTNVAGYGAALAGAPGPHVVWCTGRTLTHLRSEWHDRAGLRALAGYPKAALALGYYAWLERRLHARVDGIVAEDLVTFAALRRAGYPVRLVHSGVDTAYFKPDPVARRETRAALALPLDADVLLMAATINRQKGIGLGIEAFQRLATARPQLHLIVLGDGPARAQLEAVARDGRGAARVRFVGAVPDWDVARYYAASDILLYPTLRAEGMPHAIVEAMSCGLAVVATDRGGVRTAVRDGITGVLLPRPSTELLTRAVGGLLDHPDRRHVLGEQAAALVREQFELRASVAGLLDAFGSAGRVERERA